MNYVGIDHHRQYTHLTVMDQRGQVLRPGRPSQPILTCAAFYERLACHKGPDKAKVATARRLLTIIDKVWKEGRNDMAYRR